MTTVLEDTSLRRARNQRVNPLRLWAIVECINGKGQQVNGNGTAHAASGYARGNGTAAYSNGNGHYSPEHAH